MPRWPAATLPIVLTCLPAWPAAALPADAARQLAPDQPVAAAELPQGRSKPVLACQQAADASQPDRRARRACDAVLGDLGYPQPIRLATLINRGIIRLRSGDAKGAAADFDLAIQASPTLADAWVNKGIALTRLPGNADEAVALISHGIELGPTRPARAYFARAIANETRGRLRDAYEDYGTAARLDPDWPEPADELKRFKVVRRKVMQG
jgi:tetratricopeptide (TPR) repeat protein